VAEKRVDRHLVRRGTRILQMGSAYFVSGDLQFWRLWLLFWDFGFRSFRYRWRLRRGYCFGRDTRDQCSDRRWCGDRGGWFFAGFRRDCLSCGASASARLCCFAASCAVFASCRSLSRCRPSLACARSFLSGCAALAGCCRLLSCTFSLGPHIPSVAMREQIKSKVVGLRKSWLLADKI
jgi:hypothetical protein